MKTMVRFGITSAFLGLLGFLAAPTSASADSITNNFDNSFDYLANGVPGTMWDGVYLGYGYVPGGNNGGDGNGSTLAANETDQPGFLSLQTTRTSWAGAGDDGFYLYKVVAGDFDVSVRNVAPFANPGYHFSGLLVRAFTTNGPAWGAPFATTGTNGPTENWVNITRFNEFNVGDQVRYATNGADIQISAPYNSGNASYNTETNDDRYFRITRVGDTFSFYDKTNLADAWVLEQTVTRSDLTGIPVQVGIEDATFSAASPVTYYTDFELTGTNVVASVTRPAAPSGLAATVISPTEVQFSWTPGAGSDGSILVIRKNNALVKTLKPIDGYNYMANTNFASGDNLGGGIYVVYVAAGSGVIVTGLGNVVDTDYAAVYSYKGSGSSIVYGANPATTQTAGPAPVVGVSLNVLKPTIPVNGASLLQTIVNYGDGSTATNPATGVSFSSSDNTVAVAGGGTIGTATGIGVGSAYVIATYGGFSGSNAVTVAAPAFTDNFSAAHSYLTNGLAAGTNGDTGSTWTGLYSRPGDIPHASYAGAPLITTAFDANTTSNNVLTIAARNSGWEGTQDNGPFLFMNVPGDFQASVHITAYNQIAYNFVGLMARAYSTADNASPNGPGYTENHVNWWRFDQYGVTSSARYTANGAWTARDQTDGESVDYWLLMTRQNGTNFYFFKKANLTDPWIYVTSFTRPNLTNGVPLQVGLAQGTYTSGNGRAQFDSFSLDAAGISGGTPPSPTTGFTMNYAANNNTMTLTWTPGTNSDGSVQTSMVVMRKGAPISAQPSFGQLTSVSSVFGQGTDLGGGNYVVYRNTGNSVTVSGLTAGAVYYAAVYGYSGTGSTKSFNLAGGAGSGAVQAGVFTNIVASMPGEIPLGGVGLPVVMGVLNNGAMVDVSRSSVITSGNTNVVITTNAILTGLAIGSETNTVIFTSGTTTFTNYVVAVVRAPKFSDNFTTNQDYLVDGVTNTTWDGVYAYPTFTIPDTTFASDPAASVMTADANVTSNGVLTVTSKNVGWEFDQNDGLFLFKYVPGDFQMAVHVGLDGGVIPSVANNNPGLLARAYGVGSNGIVGAPAGGTNGETWVSWTRFDEYGIGTYARYTIDNGTTRSTQAGQGDTNLWLLVVRQQSTNFLFFQRALPTAPWHAAPSGTTYSLAQFAGVPMQVGLVAGGYDSGVVVLDQFDSFMLDAASTGPNLSATTSGGTISVSWPANWPGATLVLQSAPYLTPPVNWQTVTDPPPVTVNGINTVTIPATNGDLFFRLAPAP